MEADDHSQVASLHPSTDAPSGSLGNTNDEQPTASQAQKKKKQKQWPPTGYGKWNIRIRLLVCLLFPVLFETLDYTMIAATQPWLASSFNRLNIQSWIGISYLLGWMGFLPVLTGIADVLGRHWAMHLSLVVYMIGTAIATAAATIPMLFIARGVTGIGMAGLSSVTRLAIMDCQSLVDDSLMTYVLVLLHLAGYAAGPIIASELYWTNGLPWLFAPLIPPTFLVILLVPFVLRPLLRPAQTSRHLHRALPVSSTSYLVGSGAQETFAQRLLRVDWVGSVLLTGGSMLVLLALGLGSTGVEPKGFNSPKVIIFFFFGFLIIAAFLGWERVVSENLVEQDNSSTGRLANRPKWVRLTEPALPLNLFKSYDICATSFAAFTSGMVTLSSLYFICIYFATVKYYQVFQDGGINASIPLLYFAPGLAVGVALSLAMMATLKQPKYPIMLGSIILPIAVALITMGIRNGSEAQVDGYLAMTGVGIGLTSIPLVLQAKYSQPAEKAPTIVLMNLFFHTAGGTAGLGQLSAILHGKVKYYLTTALAKNPRGLSADQISTVGMIWQSPLNDILSIENLPEDTLPIVLDAFRSASRWCFISLIPWCCVAAVLCFLLPSIPLEVMVGGERRDERGQDARPHVDERLEMHNMNQ